MTDPSFLADLVVVVHLAFVAYVLLGQAAILLGAWLRWAWVRGPGFRWSHLGCTLFVAVEGALGWICPLTEWERELRERAGEDASERSFVGRLAHDLLFVDVDQSVLNVLYVAFGALTLATFVWVRPRPRRSRPTR